MNKLVGYTELNIGDKLIPVKFSLRALEFFLVEYGVKLNDLPSLFEETEFFDPKTGKKSLAVLPKDMIRFLVIATWSGANFIAEREGKGIKYYSLEEVYDEWIPEIGIYSKEAINIVSTFSVAILNGGTLPKQIDQEQSETDKKIKKKNLTSTV